MTGTFSWVDFAGLLVAVAALGITVAIILLGRRLSFRQQRERVRELEAKAWEVLEPIRTMGLNSKIIVMNVARYRRGYDGSNEMTWRGYAFTGLEIIEIGHSGIDVIIRVLESFFDDDHRRVLNRTSTPAPSVIEVGHIPWIWIEDIAPDGDEFDGSAIFFVRWCAAGRQPHDYITYRECSAEPFGPNDRDYYALIPELGTWRPRFFRDWLRFAGMRRQNKRMNAQRPRSGKRRA